MNAAVSPHISAARWAEILEGSSRAVECWDSLEATSNGRLARLLSGGPLVSPEDAQGVLL